jgi:hypothetical protein
MSITHKLTTTLKYSGSGSATFEDIVEDEQTAGQYISIDEAIPISATDEPVAFALDFSELKILLITADQDLTIYTNDTSGGAPDQTLSVGPTNGPISWSAGSVATNPITVDITTNIYVDNASGTDLGNLTIRALVDPTP